MRIDHVAIHRIEAGSLRRRQVGVEDADILGRHKLRLQRREQPCREEQEQAEGDQRDPRPVHGGVEAAGIALLEPPEPVVDPGGKAAPLLAAEQLGAKHRRQAESQEARKGDRPDHRHRKLAEQEPGLAGDEHHRHEHGADHQSRRDDRKADLAGALERGGERRLPLLDAVIDVLEHDDSVVDDDADRKH